MPKQRDPTALVKAVASVVREQIAKAANALTGRIDALERRLAELPTPKDGKSVTVEEVAPLIERSVAAAVATIPAPKSLTLDDIRPVVAEAVADIPRPKDGTSVTVDELLPVIKGLVDQIPRPKNGNDGTSVTADEIVPILLPTLEAKATEVALKAVADLPCPKNGEPGKSVTMGDVLPTVKEWFDAIPKPKDGDDGESVTVDDVLPHFQQAFDKWALDFERRAQDIHTRLLSTFDKPKNGEDGEDGADGLGFDDMEEEFDGERTVIRRYRRGDQVKEFRHKFHCLLERGVWKSDRSYERGDGVTFDGSYWIAQRDTKDKPSTSDAWRLAVKKGRDGKGS